jgi:hypothetical protein
MTLLGSCAIAVTLMACYGQPPCDPEEDRDKDGAYPEYCAGPGWSDCNEADPTIHECADDPEGDGIDQNCDGVDGTRPITSSTAYNPCGTLFPPQS